MSKWGRTVGKQICGNHSRLNKRISVTCWSSTCQDQRAIQIFWGNCKIWNRLGFQISNLKIEAHSSQLKSNQRFWFKTLNTWLTPLPLCCNKSKSNLYPRHKIRFWKTFLSKITLVVLIQNKIETCCLLKSRFTELDLFQFLKELTFLWSHKLIFSFACPLGTFSALKARKVCASTGSFSNDSLRRFRESGPKNPFWCYSILSFNAHDSSLRNLSSGIEPALSLRSMQMLSENWVRHGVREIGSCDSQCLLVVCGFPKRTQFIENTCDWQNCLC